MKRLIILFFLSPLVAMAQESEMITQMRSDGKIYVVIGVLLLIFLGLSVYLFSQDSRISKLEKQYHQKD